MNIILVMRYKTFNYRIISPFDSLTNIFLSFPFADFVDSHPLFRRGEKAHCEHIKRPSKIICGSSTKIKERSLRRNPLKINESDIVPAIIPIEGKSFGEANPKTKADERIDDIADCLESDLLGMESFEFDIGDISRGNSTSFLIETEEDDSSIGTIDSFSNFQRVHLLSQLR